MTPALRHRLETRIIPYQELLGNYDCAVGVAVVAVLYHTKSY